MTIDVEGMQLPNDLPVIERSAVRVVVVDAEGKVLLFHTHDRDHPHLGSWWELRRVRPELHPIIVAPARTATTQRR